MLNRVPERRNLVGFNIVASVIHRPVHSNNTNIHVTPGPQIVKDSGNRSYQSDSFRFEHAFTPGTFKTDMAAKLPDPMVVWGSARC
jgi:hypothetical protein